mmetsp:Transcript_34557/g.78966  ORF Transcript_34557/g.78966 Transcript_34557/m.78966 type:complete len:351 (+) Transcript_34557:80-1132(+)
MADRATEKAAEVESAALKKLQAAAGVAPKTSERLDWMYEQRDAKPNDDELMNKPVAGQVDKDIKDVRTLKEGTAGSLFLKTATGTTDDMLRKMREDPLFQIRREEQAAKESMLQNPLVMARLQAKHMKAAKKEEKQAKKIAKKEEKKLKKAAKKEKKAKKKEKGKKSSSSSSSNSDAAAGMMAQPVGLQPREEPVVKRPRIGPQKEEASSRSQPARREPSDVSSLGPTASLIGKREEHEARIAKQRDQALASRGAPRRMTEEEKAERLRQMELDAKLHEQAKDQRIASAMQKEKELDELDEQARKKNDQSYMKKIRAEAYMENEGSMADRLKTQRHRRQKGIMDPLERDQ